MARTRTTTPYPGWRQILVRFWPHIRVQRGLIAGSSLAMFGEVVLRLLEPWPLKFVFDRVITSTPAGGESGIPAVDALAPMPLLTLCAVSLVIIAGLRALCSYLNRVGFALAGNRVLTETRGELFVHLQSVHLADPCVEMSA